MKRFEDYTGYDLEMLRDEAIDWAMNGFAIDDYDSDAHQYIKHLIEEGDLHEDDEHDATEWLEEEMLKDRD